ncbi:phospholipase [Halobacteriales archaeon QS_3_64_16]|nr:MAG: phospholipase [Halobacteriales archaeon QS_3_64_16]
MSNATLPLEHVTIEPRTDVEGAFPAVFVLHGRGANEEDLLPIAQRFPEELLVVSLQAPDRLMGGYTWYELDLSGDGLHESQPHPEEFRRSLDLVSESIEEAIDAYPIDPGRVGLLGFSQGAIASLSLLLEAPTKYDWVVSLHGYLADSHVDREPDGIEGKPVFLAGGANDQVIPASRVQTAGDRLDELGCAVEGDTYGSAHGVGPDELDDLLVWIERQLD